MARELYADGDLEVGRFLFRGMSNADWTLQTSFDRLYADLDARRRTAALAALLSLFRDECWSLGIDVSTRDDVQLQTVGQHNGLPTRLLDWSESPYIAAFFAFYGVLEDPAALRSRRLAIWAMAATNAIWSAELGVEVIRARGVDNDRVRRQAGRFTYSRTPLRSIEEYVERCAPDEPVLWQFTIPSSDVIEAIAELNLMGMSSTLLFPDLGGAARAAKSRLAISESKQATESI